MIVSSDDHPEGRMRKPVPLYGSLREGDVVLRPISLQDIEMLRRWRARDDVRVWFGDQNVVTAEAQRRWFEHYLARPDDVMFTIALGDVPVGAVALYAIDFPAGDAEYGRLMIGEPAARGKRVADRASEALCAWGFGDLGLSRIHLWVREENRPAIALYDRIGFEMRAAPSIREGFLFMERRALP